MTTTEQKRMDYFADKQQREQDAIASAPKEPDGPFMLRCPCGDNPLCGLEAYGVSGWLRTRQSRARTREARQRSKRG
jgi:hypothetical protein